MAEQIGDGVMDGIVPIKYEKRIELEDGSVLRVAGKNDPVKKKTKTSQEDKKYFPRHLIPFRVSVGKTMLEFILDLTVNPMEYMDRVDPEKLPDVTVTSDEELMIYVPIWGQWGYRHFYPPRFNSTTKDFVSNINEMIVDVAQAYARESARTGDEFSQQENLNWPEIAIEPRWIFSSKYEETWTSLYDPSRNMIADSVLIDYPSPRIVFNALKTVPNRIVTWSYRASLYSNGEFLPEDPQNELVSQYGYIPLYYRLRHFWKREFSQDTYGLLTRTPEDFENLEVEFGHREAYEQYTHNSYEINAAIRKFQLPYWTTEEKSKLYARQMFEDYQSEKWARAPWDLVAFRGIRRLQSLSDAAAWEDYLALDSYMETRFISISLQMTVSAEWFCGPRGLLNVLHIPQNMRVHPLWDVSTNPDEQELLLPPGTIFHKRKPAELVHLKDPDYSMWIVEWTVEPNENYTLPQTITYPEYEELFELKVVLFEESNPLSTKTVSVPDTMWSSASYVLKSMMTELINWFKMGIKEEFIEDFVVNFEVGTDYYVEPMGLDDFGDATNVEKIGNWSRKRNITVRLNVISILS